MEINEILRLRREIEELSTKLNNSRQRLTRIEESCKHDWGKTEFTPVHHKGYQFEGDPPGTMGIDRQLPFYVSARTEDKWTRVCKNCGKTETTNRTEVVEVKKEPRF